MEKQRLGCRSSGSGQKLLRAFSLRRLAAALLFAVAGLVALPSQAQTETEIWSATLTVGTNGEGEGYCNGSFSPCRSDGYGSLNDTDFEWDSDDYTVRSVRWGIAEFSFGRLHLTLDRDFPVADLCNLTLEVGTHEFTLDGAGRSGQAHNRPNNYRWNNAPEAIRDLETADTITVKLVSPATPETCAASTDAALSGISLFEVRDVQAGADSRAFEDISWSPSFAGDVTEYTASIPERFDEIERPADHVALSDSSASYVFVLPNGTEEENPLSIPLQRGRVTTFSIKVTAADGVTTRTYRFHLSRGGTFRRECEAGAVWCTTMTVGGGTNPLGYCDPAAGMDVCSTAYGTLGDDSFSVDGTSYTVESLRWAAGPGTVAQDLHLTLDQDLPSSALGSLALHVDRHRFALAQAARGDGMTGVMNNYEWDNRPVALRNVTSGAGLRVQLVDLRVARREARLADAFLNDITLEDAADGSPIELGAFSTRYPDTYAYVPNTVDTVTVGATTRNSAATVAYLECRDYADGYCRGSGGPLTDEDDVKDGLQLSLEVRWTAFNIRVTAEDGVTRKTYTVRVFRTPAGVATTGLVSNTGQWGHGGVRVGNKHSGSGAPAEVWSHAQRFTTGDNSGGYTVTSVVASLGIVGDDAEPKVSIHTDSSGEPAASSLYDLTNPTFPANRNTTDRHNDPANWNHTFTAPAGSTLAANTHYWVVFENENEAIGGVTEHQYYLKSTLSDDEDPGAASGWSIANGHLRSTDGGSSWTSTYTYPWSLLIAIVGTASSMQQAQEPLTASFSGEPVSHDGATAFTLRLGFSEDVAISAEDLRDHVLSAHGGTVTGVARVDDASDLFEVTVQPDGEGAVTVLLVPQSSTCMEQGAVCTAGNAALSTLLTTRVDGPVDRADRGTELVSTDATLSALTLSGIDIGAFAADTTSYAATVASDVASTQVTATPNDTGASVAIADANGSTAGTTRTVSLSEGTNAITVTVTAENGSTSLTYTVTVTREVATTLLTASFESAPTEHDGENEFTVRIVFSDELATQSGSRLKQALSVTGGSTNKVRRVSKRRDLFEFRIQPAGTAAVGLSLASTGDCGDAAAICTADGRQLSSVPGITVNGPATASAVVNGPLVKLSWPSSRDGFGSPSGADYGVQVNGKARLVVSATLSRANVWLTLASPVTAGDTVMVAYLASAMHPLADATGQVRSGPWDGLAAANLTGIEPVVPPVAVAVPRPADPLAVMADDVRRLDASGLGLTELWALQRLTAIERLDLSGNAVSDLSPLTGLASLTDLDLSDNNVADLWPLAGLQGLERLSLSANGVTDLSALAGLANLTVLLLDGNAVADLGPLTHLTALENLGLGDNRIGDVTALQDLTRLRRLDLSGNPVVDLSPLGDVGSLVSLALPAHRVTEQAATLGRLTRLGWLWVGPLRTAPNEDGGVR